MIRIYCDWNNRLDDRTFDLGCLGSLEDINRNSHVLTDGLRVLFYQTDELESEGTIHFDSDSKRWFAIPDFTTIRYIGRSAQFQPRA